MSNLQRIFLISVWCSGVFGLRWLSLLRSTSVATIDRADHCDALDGLTKRQIKICKKNVEVMESVKKGAENAIHECQWQFQNRRWNCSTYNSTRMFGRVLSDGTREAAFVHAITSAGVAHAVTRACSSGSLERCGCDRSIQSQISEGFQWSGCSDNVAYGTAFSKTFVDSRDLRSARSGANARALMNLHNNEAGRKAIEQEIRQECKCHGVSGSCETKTCWRAMPSFREIGAVLKEKFDGATEVEARKMGKRTVLVPLHPHFKPQTDTDLVYLDMSPDFCVRDDGVGTIGTHGRPCNRSSTGIDGCELLCCSRGYSSRIVRVRERCMCKFYWCCYVKCRDCDRDIEINTCL